VESPLARSRRNGKEGRARGDAHVYRPGEEPYFCLALPTPRLVFHLMELALGLGQKRKQSAPQQGVVMQSVQHIWQHYPTAVLLLILYMNLRSRYQSIAK
jgi:hypothetical protein